MRLVRLCGEEDLLHLEFRLWQLGFEIRGVALDSADESGCSASRLDERGGVEECAWRARRRRPSQSRSWSSPINAPELLVLGVELAREVAHGLLNGLGVLRYGSASLLCSVRSANASSRVIPAESFSAMNPPLSCVECAHYRTTYGGGDACWRMRLAMPISALQPLRIPLRALPSSMPPCRPDAYRAR